MESRSFDLDFSGIGNGLVLLRESGILTGVNMQLWLWTATVRLLHGDAPATVIAPDQHTARRMIEAQYGSGSILGDYVHCVKEIG